jgi:hypothetical protein
MSLRALIATIVLCSTALAAKAENCMQYPPGPARFDCASRTHPGLMAKRERCKQEGQQMGIKAGASDRGLLKQYVMSCMQKR